MVQLLHQLLSKQLRRPVDQLLIRIIDSIIGQADSVIDSITAIIDPGQLLTQLFYSIVQLLMNHQLLTQLFGS